MWFQPLKSFLIIWEDWCIRELHKERNKLILTQCTLIFNQAFIENVNREIGHFQLSRLRIFRFIAIVIFSIPTSLTDLLPFCSCTLSLQTFHDQLTNWTCNFNSEVVPRLQQFNLTDKQALEGIGEWQTILVVSVIPFLQHSLYEANVILGD